MKPKQNTYRTVTNQIMELLEQNQNPWTKPWVTRGLGRQKNLNSLRPYTGLNALILAVQNKSTDYWLTYKQAEALGFNIRRGEKSTPVVGWFKSDYKTESEDSETGETETVTKSGLCARVFRVFNLDQCENVPDSIIEKTKRPEVETFEDTRRPEVDSLIDSLNAEIKYGFEEASYSPSIDSIKMPDRNRFKVESEFYSTLFHELGHWTGHKTRLNRSELGKHPVFNSKSYSQEELCAEMSSIYVCSTLGISCESTVRNSVAYLKGWLKFLKDNPKAFVIACQQGQKAADLILKGKG